MDVQLPDGTTVTNVPEGTTQAQIMAKLQANGHAVPSPQPVDSGPTYKGGEPLTDYARQISAPPDAAPTSGPGALEEFGTGLEAGNDQVWGNLDRATDAALKKVGIDTGGAERYASMRKYFQRPERAEALNSGFGEAGKIAGEVAMTAPLALATDNPTLLGLGSGALSTEADTPSGVALDTAIGGVGGKLGDKLLKGITRTPQLSSDLQLLLNEGVKPTIGQIAGGTGKTLEGAATSLPFARDSVIGAKNRALDTFNRAAINRTLDPIGEELPDHVGVGHEGVAYAGDRLSRAYDTLLLQMTAIPDSTFAQGMNAVSTKAGNLLPSEKAAQFTRILDGATKPLAPLGNGYTAGARPAPSVVLGDTIKDIDSQLASYGRQFSQGDPDHQTMGDLFTEARGHLNDLLARSNPDNADDLKAINTGYANLVRVEKAAGANGARDGVFTPAQLQQAIKASDTSVRKRAIGRGTGLMQDLAEAGKNVMGETIPDSGTPLRSIVTNPVKSILSIPPTVATKLLYSRPGQAAARAIATGTRPKAVQQLGHGIAPIGGILGAQGAAGITDDVGTLLYGPPN